MRKRYPQIMWEFLSWRAFRNTQARDLMALSDDEKQPCRISLANVFHPSLEVSPLHSALMKFSLRYVISWHPWMSPSLVVMMVLLPECWQNNKVLSLSNHKSNTILFVWEEELVMSVPRNTGLTDPANYCLHFTPRPTKC